MSAFKQATDRALDALYGATFLVYVGLFAGCAAMFWWLLAAAIWRATCALVS